MNKTILISSLAGLALAGCNQSTKSTSADYGTTAPSSGIGTGSALPHSSETVSAPSVTSADSSVARTSVANESAAAPYSGAAAPSSSAMHSSSTNAGLSATGATNNSASAPTDAHVSATSSLATTTEPGTSTPTARSGSLNVPGSSNAASGASAAMPIDSNKSAGSTSASTVSAIPDVTTRVTEWRLSAPEIQADLDRGVAIVRTKDAGVGAPVGRTEDAVLVALVKGKLLADSQVSPAAAKIDVEATGGEISLKGPAPSAEIIGRAIALALNTQGVNKVSSDLKMEKPAQ